MPLEVKLLRLNYVDQPFFPHYQCSQHKTFPKNCYIIYTRKPFFALPATIPLPAGYATGLCYVPNALSNVVANL